MLGFSLPRLHRPGQWDAVLKAETAHCGRASCRVRRMEGRVGVQQLPLAHKKAPCLQAGKALEHQRADAAMQVFYQPWDEQALDARASCLCWKIFQNFHLV